MSLRWAYLKRVLAGAIFGLYMAHLLYFLNPQVEISPARLALVTLVYGLICGLLFGSILWLLRWLRVRFFQRPAHGRTHGFGFVVLAAFAAAAIYWIHLEVVRIYLPIGAVRILSKATTLIGAVAFLLLLLWVAERNADRRLSRILFALAVALIAVSSFFLYQRRESYRTETRNVVIANVGTVAGQRPAILIAVRNLPYDWIVTMTGEGLLPWFERASASAYFTRLEPFPTTSPQALWASLATGKLPYRHGVTGRFSYRTPLNSADPQERFLMLPSGVGFRAWGLIPPVKRISAPSPGGQALPVWLLFERLGLRARVGRWFADAEETAASAEAAGGLFARSGTAGPRIEAALAADTASMNQLRTAEGSLDLRVTALEGFSAAQRALHIFTNDLPERASVKGEVMRVYAQQLDRMIGELARDNPQDLILVCSPTAIVPPQLPADALSFFSQKLRSADPGADDGFLLLAGPGVVHRPNPMPAFVVDVVPTLLFAGGLPIGRDMDGRIISEAFAEDFLRRTALSAIQTYEAEKLVVRRGSA